MTEPDEYRHGEWALASYRQRGYELISAGSWDLAVDLAHAAFFAIPKKPIDNYFSIERRSLSRQSNLNKNNVKLHLGTGITEASGAIEIPDWASDPGKLDHSRRRMFVHDGSEGIIYEPSNAVAKIREAIDLSHVWSRNWFHFLIEVLGRLGKKRESIPSGRILINRAVTAGVYRDAIDTLIPDLSDRLVPSADWGKVECASLYQPESFWTPGFYHADMSKSGHSREGFNDPESAMYFFQRAWPKRTPRGTRIHIWRGPNYRARCDNYNEAAEALERKGFQRIAPETLSFREQVELFYDADVIAGVSGAAFANLVFCRPNTRVVCLRDERSDTVTYRKLANGMKLDFVYLDGRTTSIAAHREFNRFEIDIKALESLLEL